MTLSFDRLPFGEQLARINAAAAADDDAVLSLVKTASAMPDSEPLAHLVRVLANAGRMKGTLLDELVAHSAKLSDPSLQYLLTHSDEGKETGAVLRALRALVLNALSRWPIARISAIAFLSRWLRRRSPADYAEFQQTVSERLSDGSCDARWLLFASGTKLQELSRDPAWGPLVADAVSQALRALANAPKSISQANAESLLARRVYADPGHFFFELLQNADDAAAASWSASITSDGVRVEHDGKPFSFHDVVGLLSIGQTTKRKDQIGFFGVGFKSVYEICERPRVQSGIFNFEIAHVSIPRSLADEPVPGSAAKTTVLELPYSSGVDVPRLFDKAVAIPPETLLTLPNVRALAVSREDDRWAWEEEWDGDVVTLRRVGGDEIRSYLCVRREFAYDGKREAGRAHISPLLVAVALKGSGEPRPTRGSTLYAFLPTAEHTGLRCMVHARFDVTLDRERLEQDSAWNEELLHAAGEAFADLVKKLADRGRAILPILSAPSELAPMAASFSKALKGSLRDYACLPGADGVLVAPAAARITRAELCAPLAGLDLGDSHRALTPLTAREGELAAALGATEFTNVDLVRFAGKALIVGAPPPPWYGDVVRGAIGDAAVPDVDIDSLAVLIDGGGTLQTPRDAMVAAAEWATLYASIKSVVGRPFVQSLPASLRDRLHVRPFDPGSLADDLQDSELGPKLLAQEDALLRAVSTLDGAQLSTLATHAVLRTTDGSRHALADGLHRLDPALVPLRDDIAARVPLVAADLAARFAPLVTRWIPSFGLRELAALLPRAEDELSDWDEDGLDVVVDLLNRAAGSMSRDLERELSSATIFRDTHGVRRALMGPGRALIPADDTLRSLFPEWPWVTSPAGAYIDGADVRLLTAADVAESVVLEDVLEDALEREAREHPIADHEWAPVLAWLSEHAGALSSREAARLLASGIWLDVAGERRRITELRLPGSGDVDAFFRSMNTRFVAHPVSITLAAALGSSKLIPPSGASTAIGDLLLHGPTPSMSTTSVAALLNEATNTLAADELARACGLPIFRDALGKPRPLAAWSTPRRDACHRPGTLRSFLSAGTLPLLSQEDETLFAKFLYAVGPRSATSADLVRCLQNDDALLGDPNSVRLALMKHASDLNAQAREGLRGLPLFENEEGASHPASALCSRRALSAFLNDSEVAQLGLGEFLIDASQEALVRELELPLRATKELVVEHMLSALVEGRRIDEQPELWTTRSAIARLQRLAHHAGVDTRAWPLAVDTRELVTAGPLATASDATRALSLALSIDARFADEVWSDLLSEEGQSRLLSELPLRRVTAALQRECPEELPIEGHPVLQDPGLVFDWLIENRQALEEDEAALAGLSSAAIIPSQKQTYRCPRDLVLDPTIPELGLSWGISRDVPEVLAHWMASIFELDRRQRRNVIDHVLAGLDAAAEDDDAARATELLAFLASALHAPNQSAEQLAERAAHTKVKARLRVPLRSGGWEKPRRARLADADGDLVEAFCVNPPKRIALGPLDSPSRALLLACGATEGLNTKSVAACLKGTDLKPGAASRLALARYVALRVAASPRLRHDWGLDELSWAVDRSGTRAMVSELLWPDALSQSLLGDSPERFPAREVVLGLPEDAASTLGFKRAAELTISEAAAFVESQVASPELLDWLESGLQAKRFSPAEVRATFAHSLLLRDDAGGERLAAELAIDGARVLFGPWRGDFSEGVRLPLLSKALLVPAKPTAAMILSFLDEVSGQAKHENETRLHEVLPRCLEMLTELSVNTPNVRLPEACLIAGRRAGSPVLGRLTEERVRMLEPRALAEALPDSLLAQVIEILPTTDGDTALTELLLRSGARDLWCDFHVRKVVPGPELAGDRGAHLWQDLSRALVGRVGQSVRVVDPLSVRGTLQGLGDDDEDVSTEVNAILHDDVLWITPVVIDAPEVLAPALEGDPVRRVAMATWLQAREWASLPKRLRAESAEAKQGSASVLDRIRGFFRGDAAQDVTKPATAKQRAPKRAAERKSDEGLFRPETKIRNQLGASDGWLDRRRTQPDFGFAFTPPRVPSPWLYAPKTIATHFHRRRQTWELATLVPPPPSKQTGMVVFRGELPRGGVVLPVPMFGAVQHLSVDDASVTPERGAFGQHLLRLDNPAKVVLHVALGALPDLDRALAAPLESGLVSVVPDDELPDPVHDFLHDLDRDAPVITQALTIRDFIRDHYRYDPSYLEDPGLGRWLARITRGRANAHIAALHAGGDDKHLGAGVCYELNTLACELLRRADIPAAIATGWVLEGGALSDPDHLWCVALLQDARGAPLWVPIDAASTQSGRPLRVGRRPAGKFRAPKDRRAKAPEPSKWALGGAEPRARSGGAASSKGGRPPKKKRGAKRPKKRPQRIPRTELLRVIRHLEKLAGQALSEEERAHIGEALEDPKAAARLLARIGGD